MKIDTIRTEEKTFVAISGSKTCPDVQFEYWYVEEEGREVPVYKLRVTEGKRPWKGQWEVLFNLANCFNSTPDADGVFTLEGQLFLFGVTPRTMGYIIHDNFTSLYETHPEEHDPELIAARNANN